MNKWPFFIGGGPHMKPLCVLVTVAATCGGGLAARGEDQPAGGRAAKLVLTGKATFSVQATDVKVQIQPGDDAAAKLAESLKKVTGLGFQLDEQTKLVVAVPETEAKNVVSFINKTLAVEGLLTFTDNAALITIFGQPGAKIGSA